MADKTAAEWALEMCPIATGHRLNFACLCSQAESAFLAYGEQERRRALQEAEAVALKLGGKSAHRHFAPLVSDCIRALSRDTKGEP